MRKGERKMREKGKGGKERVEKKKENERKKGQDNLPIPRWLKHRPSTDSRCTCSYNYATRFDNA